MKNTLRFIYLILFTFSCSQTHQQKKITEDIIEIDSLQNSSQTNDTLAIEKIEEYQGCNCGSMVSQVPRTTDLKFGGFNFNIDTLENWDFDKANEIKTLSLNYFYTVPVEFDKFKNVETLILGYIDWDTVIVLADFPKLKNLVLEGKILNLGNQPKWLNNIEIIHAEKSLIIGLESFKSLPNIKKFKAGFSGFDVFPSDFNSMKCLRYFQMGATYGTIDLNKISMKNMPCLNFIEFHSWRGNLKGTPTDVDSVRIVKVHHPNLTEKLKLKRG